MVLGTLCRRLLSPLLALALGLGQTPAIAGGVAYAEDGSVHVVWLGRREGAHRR